MKQITGLYYKLTPESFEDELSKIIVEKLAKKEVPHSETSPKLLAIGSILHCANDGDIIWGTGLHGPDNHYNFNTLDIRALRGQITSAFVKTKSIPDPKIYGDPAILLPRLFDFEYHPRPCVAIIPHITDIQKVKMMLSNLNFNYCFIDPTEHYEQVIQKLLHCSFVVSSSLHALIVADVYMVPFRWMRLPGTVEPEYKYHDYFLSTGRFDPKAAKSIEEALELGRHPIIDKKLLTKLQDDLIKSFPYDLL